MAESNPKSPLNPKRPAEPGNVPQADEQEQVNRWVKGAQEGNRQSFERLIEHFQDRVWRRALYRIKNHEEAYEVAQDVFLICFRKITTFRGESKFWTWLCRVVDNQVKNRQAWLRRRGQGRTYSIDQPLGEGDDDGRRFDPEETAADPRRKAQGSQIMEALHKNLDKLSVEHREILLLRFADTLSYDDIAETLTISIGTVKSRINRARGELRILMEEYLD